MTFGADTLIALAIANLAAALMIVVLLSDCGCRRVTECSHNPRVVYRFAQLLEKGGPKVTQDQIVAAFRLLVQRLLAPAARAALRTIAWEAALGVAAIVASAAIAAVGESSLDPTTVLIVRVVLGRFVHAIQQKRAELRAAPQP